MWRCLGLAIVRHLVELHGGSVRAESPGEGQGATFTVRLPCATRPRDLTPTRRPPTGVKLPDLGGLHVLLVEDDPDTAQVLEALVRGCGAETRTAASSPEALAVIDQWKVDLIVSDIGMPGEDGYALIRRVRSRETAQGTRAIPAVALTAYAREEDRACALAAGFQDHVSKPVDSNALLSVIAELASVA